MEKAFYQRNERQLYPLLFSLKPDELGTSLSTWYHCFHLMDDNHQLSNFFVSVMLIMSALTLYYGLVFHFDNYGTDCERSLIPSFPQYKYAIYLSFFLVCFFSFVISRTSWYHHFRNAIFYHSTFILLLGALIPLAILFRSVFLSSFSLLLQRSQRHPDGQFIFLFSLSFFVCLFVCSSVALFFCFFACLLACFFISIIGL